MPEVLFTKVAKVIAAMTETTLQTDRSLESHGNLLRASKAVDMEAVQYKSRVFRVKPHPAVQVNSNTHALASVKMCPFDQPWAHRIMITS